VESLNTLNGFLKLGTTVDTTDLCVNLAALLNYVIECSRNLFVSPSVTDFVTINLQLKTDQTAL
jgi:hypothetical protein